MKPLIDRQRQRIARKAEDAVASGLPFDASRGGVGQCHPKHADADAINEATNNDIARMVSVIGAAPARIEPSGFSSPFQHKVRLSGI